VGGDEEQTPGYRGKWNMWKKAEGAVSFQDSTECGIRAGKGGGRSFQMVEVPQANEQRYKVGCIRGGP